MSKRILSLTVIVCFFLTTLGPLPQAHADSVLNLPAPGTMINLSPAYEPVMIKGLTVHKDNPFLFDFIVDVGQDRMAGEPLEKEGEKLIKYFLASLAIPDKDVWVNLSPYEKDRMVPEALGQTDMGRDLLEQDYILKQITASLIYPEKQLGKIFWDRVYTKAQEMYGTTQVPVNTFNKVWIMADRAEVFEHSQTAFVVDSHLKVMLEEDYLALQKHMSKGPIASNPTVVSLRGSEATGAISERTTSNSHSIASQIVKQIILPELEKEVNTGKNFANLRQIFNSVILSSWYKKNLKEALLNQVYADKGTVKGVNLDDPTVKEQIYQQYLKAYKKGVFNYIKEDMDAAGTAIPRKYFSGGITNLEINPAMTTDAAALANSLPQEAGRLMDFATLASTQPSNGRLPKPLRSALIQIRHTGFTTAYDIARLPPQDEFTARALRRKLAKIQQEGPYDAAMIGNPTKTPKSIADDLVRYVIRSYNVKSQLEQLEYVRGLLRGLTSEERNLVKLEAESYIMSWRNSNLYQTNIDLLAEIDKAMMVAERNYGKIDIRVEKEGEHVTVRFTTPGRRPIESFLVRPANENPDRTIELILERMNNVGLNPDPDLREYFELPIILNPLMEIHGKVTYGKDAVPQPEAARIFPADSAAIAKVPGGIDLNTLNGMQWKVSKDGLGVEMNIDPAMIARIRLEGIDSLSPVILRMTPVASIWSLAGLQAPVK